MKKKDKELTRAKTIKELNALVAQKKKELILKKDRNLRREVAQILTIIREKEIAKKYESVNR